MGEPQMHVSCDSFAVARTWRTFKYLCEITRGMTAMSLHPGNPFLSKAGLSFTSISVTTTHQNPLGLDSDSYEIFLLLLGF